MGQTFFSASLILGFIQLVKAKISDAEKKVCPMQSRFQHQRLLEAGNGLVEPALLFANETKIEIRFSESRNSFCGGFESVTSRVQVAALHRLRRLPENLGGG